MNRLILLGNGFDLAHGLKTSYFHFIENYIRKCFKVALKNRRFEDDLIRIVQTNYSNYPDVDTCPLNVLLDCKVKKNSASFILAGDRSSNNNVSTPFELSVKIDFIEELFDCCKTSKWVDIENTYYAHLKKILATNFGQSRDKRLDDLNKSMKFLIELLNKYFRKQKPLKLSTSYESIFFQKIIKSEIVTTNLAKDDFPKNSMILNFNYTNTIESYFEKVADASHKIPINYIHGKVDDELNPIIFGFGDEMDEDYLKIESDKSKAFLQYIKSFWYFKTSNYHDLIRFIESDDFQVYIIGHSCGLSDRTMLNMIFEHQFCKSIKIFYHKGENDDNYTELTQEISRHFRDKGIMRKKIVSKEKSIIMPQL